MTKCCAARKLQIQQPMGAELVLQLRRQSWSCTSLSSHFLQGAGVRQVEGETGAGWPRAFRRPMGNPERRTTGPDWPKRLLWETKGPRSHEKRRCVRSVHFGIRQSVFFFTVLSRKYKDNCYNFVSGKTSYGQNNVVIFQYLYIFQ